FRMHGLQRLMPAEIWMQRIFDAKAAREGGVVRRSLRDVDTPSVDQLFVGTDIDTGVHLPNARVVHFDREALVLDFPEIANMPDQQVEDWILRHFAFINTRQLALNHITHRNLVHDPNKTTQFFVPPGYGRGAVVPVGDANKLVDLKGVGNSSWNRDITEEILSGDHYTPAEIGLRNGLAESQWLTAEYLRHKELERTPGYPVVRAYFLIDTAIEILTIHGNQPAYILGRQAHLGRDHASGKQFDLFGNQVDFDTVRTPLEIQQGFKYSSLVKRHAALWLQNDDRGLARVQALIDRLMTEPAFLRPIVENSRDFEFSQEEAIDIVESFSIHGLPRVDARALGLSMFRDKLHADVSTDTESLKTAEFKLSLFGLGHNSLIHFLSELEERDSLDRLFQMVRFDLMIPLPVEAYIYGMKSLDDRVRKSATTKAIEIADRYPSELGPLIVGSVLKDLEPYLGEGESPNTWTPETVWAVIFSRAQFPGRTDLLMEIAHAGDKGFRDYLYDSVRLGRISADIANQFPFITSPQKPSACLAEMQQANPFRMLEN
ncbi:MAG: hypothetical protein AAF202_01700, partial [Pseudomonadota bacterium]